jgi:membrane protein implicated in regulation of membrane protease activity
MENSTLWWLIAGAAIVLELLSGTVYLLLVATGFAAAALAAHMGAGLIVQLLVASVVGVSAVALWYLLRRRRPTRGDEDVNLDIGQTVHVEAWGPDGTATVRYRGAQWAVVPRAGTTTAPGEHRVVEVVGSRLVVDKI